MINACEKWATVLNTQLLRIAFLSFFFFEDFRQDYFTDLEPSQSLGGVKTGDPWEKTPDSKQNLTCLTCDPSEARTHSGEMTSDLEH